MVPDLADKATLGIKHVATRVSFPWHQSSSHPRFDRHPLLSHKHGYESSVLSGDAEFSYRSQPT